MDKGVPEKQRRIVPWRALEAYKTAGLSRVYGSKPFEYKLSLNILRLPNVSPVSPLNTSIYFREYLVPQAARSTYLPTGYPGERGVPGAYRLLQ